MNSSKEPEGVMRGKTNQGEVSRRERKKQEVSGRNMKPAKGIISETNSGRSNTNEDARPCKTEGLSKLVSKDTSQQEVRRGKAKYGDVRRRDRKA